MSLVSSQLTEIAMKHCIFTYPLQLGKHLSQHHRSDSLYLRSAHDTLPTAPDKVSPLPPLNRLIK